MNPSTAKSIDAAQNAVTRLIHECQKLGPVYNQNPKAAAQVNRTGKWFLRAITDLRHAVAAADLAS